MSGDPASPSRRPASRRRWLNIIAVIAVAVVLAVVLTLCARAPGPGGPAGYGARGGGGRGGASGGPGARPPTTVGIARAVVGAIPITVSALGTVTPLANVNVNARVSGMLERVTFREGERVRKGQLLAQIDPRPFQVAVDQTRAQLAHDQALLRDAQLDLTRYRTLQTQNSIAGQQVDTQAALVQQDEALVAADKAGVANAQLNLSFTHIVAPVAGVVGLRQIDPGNQITANGATPIVVVAQVDPISVVFSLPQEDIAAVQQYARTGGGGGGLPVTALDSAGGNVLAQGRLSSLDNLIDTTTGTVKARAQFANGGYALFPNQFVNVSLLIRTLANQVIVPATAVRHGPQGDFVWILQPGQKVKVRPVTVGPGTPETVSIARGVAAGETVITDGGDRLRDGGKVVLPGQARPGGGRGAGGHRRPAAASAG